MPSAGRRWHTVQIRRAAPSIQRTQVSVISPQRSQFWGPGNVRLARQPAQVRSKLMATHRKRPGEE